MLSVFVVIIFNSFLSAQEEMGLIVTSECKCIEHVEMSSDRYETGVYRTEALYF